MILHGLMMKDQLSASNNNPGTWSIPSAQAVEAYNYVGNPFNHWYVVFGYDTLPDNIVYSEGDHIEISFTLDEPLPPNMAMDRVPALPGFSYRASDGVYFICVGY